MSDLLDPRCCCRWGLNMPTYNIIFFYYCHPVFPTELYRCQCYLDDDCINLIESFQIYVEQRVQQLFPRTPDVCSFCCIRMDPIQEKMMMMCVRSILMADHQGLSREVFCQHTRVFFEISFKLISATHTVFSIHIMYRMNVKAKDSNGWISTICVLATTRSSLACIYRTHLPCASYLCSMFISTTFVFLAYLFSNYCTSLYIP